MRRFLLFGLLAFSAFAADEGNPLEEVTKYVATEKAMSKANRLPVGTYELIRPDITVTSNFEGRVEPPVDLPVGTLTGPRYTQLGSLAEIIAHRNGQYADYPQPYFDSPEDAWAKIDAMCGPVGSWEHEIEVAYDPSVEYTRLTLRNLTGCIHVKGTNGPNGEKQMVYLGSDTSYAGVLRNGGLFVENIRTNSIGVPNDQHFVIAHNVDMTRWLGHAIITSARAKHLYVEIMDSTFSIGEDQHALYIDNVAFANIQNNLIESPGPGHALRSIAQKALIKNNDICNIQCDGTIAQSARGTDIYGAPPVDIYANGATHFEGNRVVYHRKHEGSAYHAATLRQRPAIQGLDRRRDGDHYIPLVWGTEAYNDPASWEFPVIETVVKDMKLTCLGEPPCKAWGLRSTYPMGTIGISDVLMLWWQANEFPDWDTLLANADPTWHATLNLMTDDYKAQKLSVSGRGLSQEFPLAVPEGWKQKARIVFENVTGPFDELWYTYPFTAWCLGEVNGNECVDFAAHGLPEIVIEDGDTPPVDPPVAGDWRDALIPFIPPVGEIRRIPGTALTPVLLPNDGTAACEYLECRKSNIVLQTWTGMSFDRGKGVIRLIAPGGHSDIGANSVYRFDIGSLTWTRDFDYAQPLPPFPDLVDEDGDGVKQCVELEQGPLGVHNYDSLVYAPPLEGTVMLRVRTYGPVGRYGCQWSPVKQNTKMQLWKDTGGYEELPLDEHLGVDEGYIKAEWDADRQKIIILGVRGRLREIDPFTWEMRDMKRLMYGSQGGVMAMEGRNIYVSSPPGMLLHANISLEGNPGIVTKLVEQPDWSEQSGLAVSEGIVVGWDGTNGILRYDTHTGEFIKLEAPGDDLSTGDNKVYSKWNSVMPGVFIGISDNDGFVIYRDY